MRFLTHFFIVIIVAAQLSACALFKEEEKVENWPAERFYQEGKDALDIGDYQTAIEHFENLQAHHPFGLYAQQAQLDIAYAYYKYNEPESAIAAAEQFIKLYPRHERVDYAYYLKGLARFPTKGPMERFFKLDIAERNPRAAQESLQYFTELVNKFPDSPYGEDARRRVTYLRNNLARHEMQTARFYMQKGAFIAAVNRAKYVIERYPQTPSIPDALALLADAYANLGLDQLAQDARRVLALNYPDYQAVKKETPRANAD